jgi:hypothetical protein
MISSFRVFQLKLCRPIHFFSLSCVLHIPSNPILVGMITLLIISGKDDIPGSFTMCNLLQLLHTSSVIYYLTTLISDTFNIFFILDERKTFTPIRSSMYTLLKFNTQICNIQRTNLHAYYRFILYMLRA